MFRNISRRILTRGSHSIFTRENATVQAQRKVDMEINRVKLMGTIESDVTRLKNGSLNLYLKTANEDDERSAFCVHKVAIANRELLKMVGTRLKTNDRIYIGGKLRTENVLVDYSWKHNVEILANELYFLDQSPETINVDEQAKTSSDEEVAACDRVRPFNIDGNDVELLAYIATDIKNERNLSVFSVVTHFTQFKGKPNECISHDIHRILIYNDPELIPIARTLRRNDRVYITGSVHYSRREYPDGNTYSSGYVRPSSLLKLFRFATDEPIDESLNRIE